MFSKFPMFIFLFTPQIKTGDVVIAKSAETEFITLSMGESNEDDSWALLLILGIALDSYSEAL